jgi:hypothetical protein
VCEVSDTWRIESQAGPPDRVPLRASDAERERVAGLLRDAAAEGRITLEELSERLELAWAARTQAELDNHGHRCDWGRPGGRASGGRGGT